MDALRKAEESKNQAVQEQKADARETRSAKQGKASAVGIKPAPPATDLAHGSKISDETNGSRPTSLPDIPLEFAEPAITPETKDPPPPAVAVETTTELELSPIVPGLDQSPAVPAVPAESAEAEVATSVAKSTAGDNSVTTKISLSDIVDKHKRLLQPPAPPAEEDPESQVGVAAKEPGDLVSTKPEAVPKSGEPRFIVGGEDKLEIADVEPVIADRATNNAVSAAPPVKIESKADNIANQDTDRSFAKSMFQAKRRRQTNRRRVQIVGFAMAAILVAGVGTYVYNSLRPNSGIGVPLANTLAIRPSLPTETELGTVQRRDAAVETTNAVIIEATPANENTTSLSSLEISSDNSAVISQVIGENTDVGVINQNPVAAAEALPSIPVIDVENSTASSEASALTAFSADLEPVNRISFRRRESVTAMDPLVTDAYNAYQQGKLKEAQLLYQQALVNTPQKRDALLGLAAIAALENESITAMELYSRLLVLDPSDPVAQASLLELMPAGSLTEQERQLRRLLERHPAVAPLAYALGNFYASQQRWSEAQPFYFRALQLAKTGVLPEGEINPDYAFNLAVSLEHLNQAQPAKNYYQEALEYAVNYPAGFDLSIARTRLENIGRTTTR